MKYALPVLAALCLAFLIFTCHRRTSQQQTSDGKDSIIALLTKQLGQARDSAKTWEMVIDQGREWSDSNEVGHITGIVVGPLALRHTAKRRAVKKEKPQELYYEGYVDPSDSILIRALRFVDGSGSSPFFVTDRSKGSLTVIDTIGVLNTNDTIRSIDLVTINILTDSLQSLHGEVDSLTKLNVLKDKVIGNTLMPAKVNSPLIKLLPSPGRISLVAGPTIFSNFKTISPGVGVTLGLRIL